MGADSSILEVFGGKEGAAIAYDNMWTLPPSFITRGDTGEVVAARLRRVIATSAAGARDLVAEVARRVRRGGAGDIVFRADSR